jgi:hypothetical protein
VAAQLAKEPGVEVSRTKGHLGELRVAVDGKDVVETSPLWYPTPSSVVERIRTYLRESPPA